MMRRRSFIAAVLPVVALVAASACWPDRLTGKACDYEHPCFDGFRCQDGFCVDAATPLPTEMDGGSPPDTDAGSN